MAKYFNKNLKYIRKIYNISQFTIAKELGIDRSSISRWEKGNIDVPLEAALTIADFLHFNYADIFFIYLTTLSMSELEKIKKNIIEKH